MPTPEAPDFINALIASVLGLIGRMMSMVEEKRSPWSKSLAWEIPLAIGLGVSGWAIAEHHGYHGLMVMSASIGLAYIGPKALSYYGSRLLKILNSRETPP